MKKNNITITHPEWLKKWNYKRNDKKKLYPEDFTASSNQKVWWVCDKGHEYLSRIDSKKYCPYCINQKVLKGYNDLKTTHPEIAKEWHPTKNGHLKSTHITAGSDKEIWWKCRRCGHEWSTRACNRKSGSGCPECSTSSGTSFNENVVYYYIKKYVSVEVLHNVRLKNFNKFELDIYIPSLSLAIEYDGEYWHKEIDKDLSKNKLCQNKNITLIRIREPNCERLKSNSIDFYLKKLNNKSLEETLEVVFDYINKNYSFNIKLDIDIDRDRHSIENLTSRHNILGSLEETTPELAKEWHPKKNGRLRPSQIYVSYEKPVWWKCSKCGHEWEAKPYSRKRYPKCPQCKKNEKIEESERIRKLEEKQFQEEERLRKLKRREELQERKRIKELSKNEYVPKVKMANESKKDKALHDELDINKKLENGIPLFENDLDYL